jgi:hypothetical protein
MNRTQDIHTSLAVTGLAVTFNIVYSMPIKVLNYLAVSTNVGPHIQHESKYMPDANHAERFSNVAFYMPNTQGLSKRQGVKSKVHKYRRQEWRKAKPDALGGKCRCLWQSRCASLLEQNNVFHKTQSMDPESSSVIHLYLSSQFRFRISKYHPSNAWTAN